MTSVSEVMTRSPTTITPKETIQQAAKLMEDLDVGSLPVRDGEHLSGMLTDRDLVVRALAKGMGPDTSVQDVVTEPVSWCFEDDELNDVQKKMEDAQIRRVPVVSRDKRLVGILALGDLATGAAGNTASTLNAVSSPSGPKS